LDHSFPTRTAPRSSALTYNGRVGELYAIFLLNLLLTVLTAGIFRFWAITRTRRYIWSRMRFQGSRFEYIGTGGEMFVGFVGAVGLVAGLGLVAGPLAYVLEQVRPWLAALPVIALCLALLVLAGAGFYASQRYRLTRTLWRGTRGGMAGSALSYGAAWLAYGAMLPLTLFQMRPWVQIRLLERRINASVLGNTRFAFTGRARSVYGRYLLACLGSTALLVIMAATVFTTHETTIRSILSTTAYRSLAGLHDPHLDAMLLRLAPVAAAAVVAWIAGSALLRCWYMAGVVRHVCAHTTLAEARFASTVTGFGLLWLAVGNLLIAVLTLGLGWPFVTHRNLRYLARNLHIEGAVAGAFLDRDTMKVPAFGEGLFQALDAGGITL
jgi:uncharacterized membrane protein YjgN (DUF898 family)